MKNAKTNLEKDLGVYFQSDLKWGVQVDYSSARANKILGIIWKNFEYFDENLVKLLYTSLARPLIEYGIYVWSAYFEGEKKQLSSK